MDRPFKPALDVPIKNVAVAAMVQATIEISYVLDKIKQVFSKCMVKVF